MESLGDYLKKFEVKKRATGPRSERAALIEQFVERINLERTGTSYRPTTGKIIAIMTSKMTVSDLYYFYKQCQKSKSFGKTFYGSLKTVKQLPKEN